jgi:hypothetical protein
MLKAIMDKLALFDTSFQTAYLERGVNCYVDFMDEVPSAPQLRRIHVHYMVHYLVLVKEE